MLARCEGLLRCLPGPSASPAGARPPPGPALLFSSLLSPRGQQGAATRLRLPPNAPLPLRPLCGRGAGDDDDDGTGTSPRPRPLTPPPLRPPRPPPPPSPGTAAVRPLPAAGASPRPPALGRGAAGSAQGGRRRAAGARDALGRRKRKRRRAVARRRAPPGNGAGGRVGWFVSGLSRLSAAATACGRAARLQRELGQRAAAAWAAKGLGGGGCPAAAVFVPVLPQP